MYLIFSFAFKPVLSYLVFIGPSSDVLLSWSIWHVVLQEFCWYVQIGLIWNNVCGLLKKARF